MNLAVKLYSSVSEKPAGIPDDWPAEVVELGEGTTLPEGGGWQLMTVEEYNTHRAAYQSAYNTWRTNYTASETATKAVNVIIARSQAFGRALVNKNATENVLQGITQAGKSKDLLFYCHKLVHCLETGSLYAALNEIDILLADTSQAKTDLSPFLTDDKLNAYKVEIQHYLGLN